MNESRFGKGSIDKPEDFLQDTAWLHEEIAGAFQPAIWVEKDPKTGFKTYPKRNQKTQNSCVSYVLSKELAVDELSENGIYREISPRSIYPYTFVAGGGSNSITAHKLAVRQGMTLEMLLPTDGLTEDKARSDDGYVTDAKQIALIYRPQSFVECATDLETIASILYNYEQQGLKKVVSVTVVGTNNGTWLTLMPFPPKKDDKNLWYHRIAITDFGLINGKKFLSFDNSWGDIPGNAGQQFLSEQYMPFIYGGIYTLNIKDNWQQLETPRVQMPKYNWKYDLQIGSAGEDVKVLQQALQSMGFFPISSVVAPTGQYFGITKAAVNLFQAALGIPQTGIVDELTREKLNGIFKV